jgi:hypothetical protein
MLIIETKCRGTGCLKTKECRRFQYKWKEGQAEKWFSPPTMADGWSTVDPNCEIFISNAPFVRARSPVDVPD